MDSCVDDVADMLLCAVAERVEKLLKLLRRLATEHRQQLLVRSERCFFGPDVVSFHWAENLLGVQFRNKIRQVQFLQQEHVVATYHARV